MSKQNNRHIEEAVRLSVRLKELADRGESVCEDDGCALLYGVVRDCGYNIAKWAEREREHHIRTGTWEEAS